MQKRPAIDAKETYYGVADRETEAFALSLSHPL
jgi:hypothetical protein